MTIGVRAHDFGRGSFAEFAATIKKIKETGYESIQLAPAKCLQGIETLQDLSSEQVIRIKGILDENEMKISVLGCYVDISQEDSKARSESVDVFKKYIGYARLLGADMIATETSYNIVSDEYERKRGMEYVTEAMKEIVKEAGAQRMLVAIEPVAVHVLNSPELTKDLLAEVAAPELKVLYDPVNLLLPETVNDQQQLFQRVKECLAQDIAAIHIKDFIVAEQEKKMVPLGRGVVKIKEAIGWVTELHPEIPVLREDSFRESDKEDIAYLKECLPSQRPR